MFEPKEEDIQIMKGAEIDLLLESIYINRQGIKLYIFHIYPKKRYNKIGRITLRLGESEEIYYFGNIGYNICKKYRGNYFAAKACLLLKNLLEKYNVEEQIVLTTNPNNIASHKTCKYIGCDFIEAVQVPKHNRLYSYRESTKLRYLMPTMSTK